MFQQSSFVFRPLLCSNAVVCNLSQGHGRSFASSGAFPGSTKFAQDRTETRIKRKVARGQVARYGPDDSEPLPFLVSCRSQQARVFSLRPRSSLRNRPSWRVQANASRRDWFVTNSNCFCRSFHLSRNGGIASKITARDPFRSDGYLFFVSVADRQEIRNETVRNHLCKVLPIRETPGSCEMESQLGGFVVRPWLCCNGVTHLR